MIDPVPSQSVIINLEFSRGSLDRCPSREKPLDPLPFEMIATLTAPRSRTLLSRHPVRRQYISKNNAVALIGTKIPRPSNCATIVQNCGAVMALFNARRHKLKQPHRC
jgi:hypothetical protein